MTDPLQNMVTDPQQTVCFAPLRRDLLRNYLPHTIRLVSYLPGFPISHTPLASDMPAMSKLLKPPGNLSPERAKSSCKHPHLVIGGSAS
jgi:hypothetical protein